MGNYDLYGNNYATRQEALNAEMAQCASIEAAVAYREIKKLRSEMQQQQQQQLPDEPGYYDLLQYCQNLEKRIEELEKLTYSLRPA